MSNKQEVTLADRVWNAAAGVAPRIATEDVTIYWDKLGYKGEGGWEVCTYAEEEEEGWTPIYEDEDYFIACYYFAAGEWTIGEGFQIHEQTKLNRPPVLWEKSEPHPILEWMQKNQDEALAKQAEEE